MIVNFGTSGGSGSGNPALTISRTDPPAPHPERLGMTAGLLAGYGSLTLSRPGAAIRSRDTSSNLSPLRGGYNTAPRGAAAIMVESRRGGPRLTETKAQRHASLVVAAARYGTTDLLSLDERRFQAIAPLWGEAFRLLPTAAQNRSGARKHGSRRSRGTVRRRDCRFVADGGRTCR